MSQMKIKNRQKTCFDLDELKKIMMHYYHHRFLNDVCTDLHFTVRVIG